MLILDEEPHIVREYHLKGCVVRIADNDCRNLSPAEIQRRINHANDVASQIIRNAAARGVVV